MTTKQQMLGALQKHDNPATHGLRILSDDGQGHQYWAAERGCVVIRFDRHESDGEVNWSDDVSGWETA